MTENLYVFILAFLTFVAVAIADIIIDKLNKIKLVKIWQDRLICYSLICLAYTIANAFRYPYGIYVLTPTEFLKFAILEMCFALTLSVACFIIDIIIKKRGVKNET